MSIERQGGVITFCCDKCPETHEAETGVFGEAWATAKQQGWRSYQIGGVWCHSCPSCSEDFARNPT